MRSIQMFSRPFFLFNDLFLLFWKFLDLSSFFPNFFPVWFSMSPLGVRVFFSVSGPIRLFGFFFFFFFCSSGYSLLSLGDFFLGSLVRRIPPFAACITFGHLFLISLFPPPPFVAISPLALLASNVPSMSFVTL